ncbi:hypothetical protein [Pedobacter suwonensis]|nr:hypothetical protein [Pedobacter suwonensis]
MSKLNLIERMPFFMAGVEREEISLWRTAIAFLEIKQQGIILR